MSDPGPWGGGPQPPPGHGPGGPPPYPAQPPARPPGRRGGNKGLLIGLGAGGAALLVIVVIVAVVVFVQLNRTTSDPAPGSAQAAPVTKQDDGTVVLAKPGVTSPVVDIWEDYQCPVCKEFEKTSGATVQRLAADGKAKIVYHPMTIFAAQQAPAAHDNSLRALNASMAAPAGKWIAFHDKLYANQPPETQANGFPPDTLVTLGQEAGIGDAAFTSAVNGTMYRGKAEESTRRALTKEHVAGTPTVRVNGRELSTQDVLQDKNAIPEAVKNAH